jgi:hypothetical protein
VAEPRVIGYDDLHVYLEEIAMIEQELADDLDDEGKDGAERHWAKAEAYREIVNHIEYLLECARG